MEATQLALLYGAEVWADALDKDMHRNPFAQAQKRKALRLAVVSRTVSGPAVMFIAGVIPVALLEKKRKAVYHRKGEHLREVVASEERQRTLTERQLSWQNGPRGRWTAQLINNLDPWLNGAHGDIDYSANKGLQSYLLKIGKVRSPNCVVSNRVMDDAEHTFFSCERWDGFRQRLYADTGELSPNSIPREMLKSVGSWSRVTHYVRLFLLRRRLNSTSGRIG